MIIKGKMDKLYVVYLLIEDVKKYGKFQQDRLLYVYKKLKYEKLFIIYFFYIYLLLQFIYYCFQ